MMIAGCQPFRVRGGGVLIVAAALAASAARADVPPNDGDPMVRFAYVIPSDRTPQENGVATFQSAIRLVHHWYGEQMWRWGYGYKSFRYETEVDGVTPLVHVIHVAESQSELCTAVVANVRTAVIAAGAPSIYDDGEVWVFLPETHLQDPNDGSISCRPWCGGGAALVEDGASGDRFGFAFVGSEALPLWAPGMIQDHTPYHGLIIPELGPAPLVFGVTWAGFMGETLSEISSCFLGGLAHEMGHGFGLAHDPRNDGNFRGNLMYNGFRGFRGWLYPDDYPDDFARLSFASAMFLDANPFFTIFEDGVPQDQGDVDEILPVVAVTTQGDVDPLNGHLHISFEASDDLGLVAARLRLGGKTAGEMTLSGTQVSATFVTPYREVWGYNPGDVHRYLLTVYDASGNTDTDVAYITPGTRFNHAPLPHVRPIRGSQVYTGEAVELRASGTQDLDDNIYSLLFEWDLDGDGIFDTSPTHETSFLTSFDAVGVPVIRLRVTDPEGAVTVSTPVNVRVAPACPGDLDGDNDIDISDLAQLLGSYGTTSGASYEDGDLDEDGDVDLADLAELLGVYGTTCE